MAEEATEPYGLVGAIRAVRGRPLIAGFESRHETRPVAGLGR